MGAATGERRISPRGGRRHLLRALPGPEPAVAHRFSPPHRPRSDALWVWLGGGANRPGVVPPRPVPSDRHPRHRPCLTHTQMIGILPTADYRESSTHGQMSSSRPLFQCTGPAGTGRSVTPADLPTSRVRSVGRQTSSARQVQMNSFGPDRRDPPPPTAADLGVSRGSPLRSSTSGRYEPQGGPSSMITTPATASVCWGSRGVGQNPANVQV